jgi:hypothetical protein
MNIPDHPLWVGVVRKLQAMFISGERDFSEQRLKESFIDDMETDGMTESQIIDEINAGRLDPINNCLAFLQTTKAISIPWQRVEDSRMRRSIFPELMKVTLPAKITPDVTIQMLVDHAICSRQKILTAIDGHELTRERNGKADWYVYSELRPFLPKGTPWPISVEMLKKKTAKNSK